MTLTHKQKIGQIGENIATKHLKKLGFKILDRNYRKKCGEIDIVAKKGDILHFVEVKSVSRETFSPQKDVSYETSGGKRDVSRVSQSYETRETSQISKMFHMKPKIVSYETFLPEENIHFWKRKRMSNTIKIYLMDKRVSDRTEWQIDSLSVFIDLTINKAKIRFLENITW